MLNSNSALFNFMSVLYIRIEWLPACRVPHSLGGVVLQVMDYNCGADRRIAQ
jgi:hypothetical protein